MNLFIHSKKAATFIAISILMVAGFQNCSQTSFKAIDQSSDKVQIAPFVRDTSSVCSSVALPLTALDFSQANSQYKILNSKVGEIICGQTMFIVTVTDNIVAPADLIYLFDHTTHEYKLVSRAENGQALFIPSHLSTSISISKNGKYVFFPRAKQATTDAGTLSYDLVRRDITTGQIEIVNKDGQGSMFKPTLTLKTVESEDGRYVLFPAGLVDDESLIKKDMLSGQAVTVSKISSAPVVYSKVTTSGGGAEITGVKSSSISSNGEISLFTSLRLDHQTGVSQDVLRLSDTHSGSNVLSILTGEGMDRLTDGVDEMVKGRTLVSGDGKVAYVEAAYIGGNRLASAAARSVHIVQKNLITHESQDISVDSASGKIGMNWSLQSTTKTGKFVCFLSAEANVIDGVVPANGNRLAYVKNIETGALALVSKSERSLPAGDVKACELSEDGMNATFSVFGSEGDQVYHSAVQF